MFNIFAFERAIIDIALERGVNRADLRIVSYEQFTQTYAGTPEDIGTIDVEYEHTHGLRALYGVTADGRVSCYAD
jgi:hypothetical protein